MRENKLGIYSMGRLLEPWTVLRPDPTVVAELLGDWSVARKRCRRTWLQRVYRDELARLKRANRNI